MLNISPLKWTDLNPTATPFIPRNFNNEDIEQKNIKSRAQTESRNNSSVNVLHSKPSTSKDSTQQKVNEKSKSSKKSSPPKKPSNVTLEQFIIEKLKIENENVSIHKKASIGVNHKKKTQTHEIPVNSLDSSAPTRRRGKEREIPKPKKPTPMKKIIIQEKSGLNVKSIESIEENTDNDKNCEEKVENLEINDIKNDDFDEINKKILHCRAYREYCCQTLTQEIDNFVVNLLSDLVIFQDRMHLKDPLKAKVKKRLCFGFREVTKYAMINKVKMLVIAPDIEKIETKGGLNDTLTNLLEIAANNQTPIVFALTRKNLGITCKKKGYISCIGILNYDGSQENFKQLICLCETARIAYNLVFDESINKLKTLLHHQIEDLLLKLPDIPEEFQDLKQKLIPNNRRLIKRKEKTSL